MQFERGVRGPGQRSPISMSYIEGDGQKIRPAEEVLVERWGTCLDLATTYSAALEGAGLHPVIVLCDGHAFAGHLREERQLPELVLRDERMILNMLFLKYATAAEMDKLLPPFYGEGASHSSYEPANLLILQDNARNMKRTMDLLAMFDSDTFAKQRVRLFDIEHAVPSDLGKELETVFKAYALSDKTSVKFLPVDRINILIAVAPNGDAAWGFTTPAMYRGMADATGRTVRVYADEEAR